LSRAQAGVDQLREKMAAPDYSRLVPEAVQEDQKYVFLIVFLKAF
jgi:hypothetical protein